MKVSGLTTKIVHSDRKFGVEHGAIRKPIHTAVQYDYPNIEDLIGVFQGRVSGSYNYSRMGTPTTAALETKINMLEGGIGTHCFATGMGSISAVLLTLLRAGDHLIASRHVFLGTNSLFGTMRHLGIEVTTVDASDVKNIEAAIQSNTRMVFVETIANPGTEIPDLGRIGDLCEKKSLIYVVDNTITSPALFKPRHVKASIVVNAMSKTLGGHGAALGGSMTDTGLFNWEAYPNIASDYRVGSPEKWGLVQVRKKGMRDMGASLSSEHAHQIGIGLETLSMRVEKCSSNALALAHFLSNHPNVSEVRYPGLETHAQHHIAKQFFKSGSWLLSFEIKDVDLLIPAMNQMEVASRATGMGDTRTLVIPVAPTVFHEAGIEGRREMNIPDGLIRVSVGIEDIEDLISDFDQALSVTK